MSIPNNNKPPILVIGMTRSATTMYSNILGSLPGVHAEVEPHSLWKNADFHRLTDDDVASSVNTGKRSSRIRNQLLSWAGESRLVEKSPSNCLRPHLVFEAFPDAKIVYANRDAESCIAANIEHSLARVAFHPRMLMRKHLKLPHFSGASGRKDPLIVQNSFNPEQTMHYRNVFQQLRPIDVLSFGIYSSRMLRLRNRGLLPFGPKIEGFANIVKNEGLPYYHARVYRQAEQNRNVFRDLWGESFMEFDLKSLVTKPDQTLDQLFDFCEEPLSDRQREGFKSGLDSNKAFRPTVIDRHRVSIADALRLIDQQGL
jgi:hypothetical protein